MATTLFPDATNTGVPAGITLTPSSSLVITQAGAVVSGLDIQGTVLIEAPNVTLENCRITSGNWSVVIVADGVTGAVVQNCEINGLGSTGGDATGISGQGTFLNNNIYNVENGFSIVGTNVDIQGNYVHDMNASGSPHYDGIQIDGNASSVNISNNTIINNNGQTSAVMVDNGFGPISNIQVHDNLLVGGAYTVYSDGRGSSASITGVSFTNNHIGGGQFGDTSFDNNTVVYNGNVNDGAALAGTLNTTANVNSTTTGSGGNAGVSSGASAPPSSWNADQSGTGTGGTVEGSAFGSSSSPPPQTTDTVAPDAPVITGAAVVQSKVQISGIAEAGSTIDLYEGSNLVGTADAGADGHWNLTTSTLSQGTHSFVATATDAAGNASGFSQALDPVIGSTTAGQHAPTPPVRTADAASPAQNHLTGSSGTLLQFTGIQQNQDHAVTLTGTADSGSQLTVYDGTGAVGSVTTDTNGHWTFTTCASSNHSHSFTAALVDSDGDTVATTTGAAIVGTNSQDKLISTSGNDILTGRGGADAFVFAPNFGHDTITNFTAQGAGHDTIDFSKSVFDNFATVLAHASQDGQDVVISAGSDTLALKNMKLSALNSHDFHFG